MKKTRKIISLLLSLLMIITSVPLMAVNSFAATNGTTGDCTWTLDSDGVLTISGKGKMKDYSWNEAPSWGTSITKVVIENGVTSIGDYAFIDCTSLTSITIGNGVTSIGFRAFSGCTSLTSITIPDSVTSIDTSAFADTAYYNDESNWNNGLLYIGNHLIEAKEDVSGNVEIKQGTKTVASCAFLNCSSLKSITIPESVTAIGWGAFGCDEEGDPIYGFKIYGTVGSEAERYADDNRLEFISIDGTPVKSFPDVTREDWYYSAVKYNSRNSYITGYSNGTFGPSNNIQRQDFVLILARIAGADLSAYEGQNGGFSDVQTGSYYASAVAWAKDTGVANGFSADNFGVGTFISREQICIMLCRYLNGSASGNADTILNAYPDGGNTSPWAKESVAWAVENGIIGNSDYLNPNGNAGRAEVAQIIYNMSNNGIL